MMKKKGKQNLDFGKDCVMYFQYIIIFSEVGRKYAEWLPEKMQERTKAKAAALKAEMERMQAFNLEEEF